MTRFIKVLSRMVGQLTGKKRMIVKGDTMIQETQQFKTQIIAILDTLPLNSLKLLAEFALFLQSRVTYLTGKGDDTAAQLVTSSLSNPLLAYAGQWHGDDIEECLTEVYATRSKEQKL